MWWHSCISPTFDDLRVVQAYKLLFSSCISHVRILAFLNTLTQVSNAPYMSNSTQQNPQCPCILLHILQKQFKLICLKALVHLMHLIFYVPIYFVSIPQHLLCLCIRWHKQFKLSCLTFGDILKTYNGLILVMILSHAPSHLGNSVL